MTSKIVYRTRRLLIEIGKTFPFLLCVIVAASYVDCLFALCNQRFVLVGEEVTLYTPIMWLIGEYYEIQMFSLFVTSVLVVAIQTCICNKLSVLFLFFQLYEKNFFNEHIFNNSIYYTVIIFNIFISSFFIYKGAKIILSK